MQRQFRLTRSEDFKRVRQCGKSYAHPLIVLIAQTNDGMKIRVGVAAGKAVGAAVKRNRAKRLMRAAMRSFLPSIHAGWDLVLIARPGLASASLDETRRALFTVLRLANLTSLSNAA